MLSARYYAQDRIKKCLRRYIRRFRWPLLSGILMAFVGVAMARPALALMERQRMSLDSRRYICGYIFLGMPFFMLYNYGAAILRAVGDTKRPLLFLLPRMANVVLDLLLVNVIR